MSLRAFASIKKFICHHRVRFLSALKSMLPLCAVALLLMSQPAGKYNNTRGRRMLVWFYIIDTHVCFQSGTRSTRPCSANVWTNVSPVSWYHAATAHTVLTALIRWVQLSQLMLSDLPNQCVEGIFYSLQTHRKLSTTTQHPIMTVLFITHTKHFTCTVWGFALVFRVHR